MSLAGAGSLEAWLFSAVLIRTGVRGGFGMKNVMCVGGEDWDQPCVQSSWVSCG